MRIERITTEKELRNLQAEWTVLLQRSTAETVFLTWQWITSWWAAYGGGKELFVLIARDEAGECQGVAPFYVERRGGTRLLRFLGDGTYDSDYLDFILARGQEILVLEAFFDELKKLRSHWDVLQLNEIPATSDTLEALRNLTSESHWLLRQENVPCGIGKLPATWEEFLQMLKPRFRTSLRGCLRNLEQWNGAFEVLTEKAGVPAWLDELFALHSDRWALRQQSGVFADPGKRDFYARMARSFFDRGWLHMTRWRVHGSVLACQFGFIYGQTYHLLQEGFDTRCIHVSPGITLRAATIRDLIARGVHTYDFLGGIGRHKTDWGAQEKKSWRMALAPRSAAGFAYIELPRAIQSAKDRLKQILPAEWIQGRKKAPSRGEQPAQTDAGSRKDVRTPETRSWKNTVAEALYRSGLLRVVQLTSRRIELRPNGASRPVPLRSASSPKFVIMCYHRVGAGGVPLYSALEPEVFEAQMRFLRERYRVISLSTLLEGLSSPGPSQQSVAITFDDGYRDVYTHAFPILKKYQIPATIYLSAEAIEMNQIAWYDRVFLALSVAPGDKLDLMLDRPRRFLLPTAASRLRSAEEIISYLRTIPDDERKEFCMALEKQVPLPAERMTGRMLTWEQIGTMQSEGVSFGSHTLTHPAVSRLDSVGLERELRESKARLEERLGVAVEDFAYPFGKPEDYGKTAGAVADCGYRSASTTNWGINTSGTNPYELRRVAIGEERQLSVFAMRLAQLFLSSVGSPVRVSEISAAKQDSVCSSS